MGSLQAHEGVYTLPLLKHQICPLQALISPRTYSHAPASLHYFCSFILHCIPSTPIYNFYPIFLGSLSTAPLPFLPPLPSQNGHNGYYGLVSYWFARLCGTVNGNWQVVLAHLLLHSVLWARKKEMTSCLAFSYIIRHFGKPTALLAAILRGLFFALTDGDDTFLQKVVDFQQTILHYIPQLITLITTTISFAPTYI